ncbi:UNVERIFIED_CONTAM: hypothetical protein Slati_1891600 [Sesamum latifolium]|uniref:Uncharacterized protein n=1 Tax=Sesamum latifolium TaxID=2727402 RepID=A0AAW2X0P6_9LAMI
MDWSVVRRLWEKWAPSALGSSGQPLKAALLINYDPTGPSRLVSTIAEQEGIKADPIEISEFVSFVKRNKLQMETFLSGQTNVSSITSVNESKQCNFRKSLGNYTSVDQTGNAYGFLLERLMGISPRLLIVVAVLKHVSCVLNSKAVLYSFLIDLVSSIHESWFCARCLNTSMQAGEGAIVMQTSAFLLVGLAVRSKKLLILLGQGFLDDTFKEIQARYIYCTRTKHFLEKNLLLSCRLICVAHENRKRELMAILWLIRAIVFALTRKRCACNSKPLLQDHRVGI